MEFKLHFQFKSALVGLMICFLARASASGSTPDVSIYVKEHLGDLDWWQTTIIYQVYPRSFMDSDGDGVGDLKGIEQKAAYFKELGVGAVWLNPIYESPMADFGYDINNYTSIYSKFGTFEDFKKLKATLNNMGIKLIMDFVPNHTSDESEWFKKSVKRIDPYTDFYVWKDPKGLDSDGNPIPPNNWISIFNVKSAWTYNAERKQFYLHQFLDKQPDINYRCKELRDAMMDVIKFWLNVGIDGFRIDAVPYLVEEENFLDEEYIDPNGDHNDYENMIHAYTKDQPLTLEILRSWRVHLDTFSKTRSLDTRAILTEAYTDLKSTMKYYGNESNPISEMPFNFQLITAINSQSNAKDVANSIKNWYGHMPKGLWANWVMDNHDNFRAAKRYGSDMVDALNTLVMLLPGTAIVYYGDEIGMDDTFIRWDQTKDPAGIVLGEDKYLTVTRDAARTPMQWNDSLSAGFSTSVETWLPVNPNFWKLNVEAQRKETRSHLKVFKKLAEARNLKTIQHGSFSLHTQGNWTLMFTRALVNHTTFIVLINMGTEQVEASLSQLELTLPNDLYVYVASINSVYKDGDKITNAVHGFVMRPKTAVVLTTEPVVSNASGSGKLAMSISALIPTIFFTIWMLFR